MSLTDLAIRKRMTTLSAIVLVIILGLSAYLGLPREASPDVKIPYVMVYAPYYGTSPQDMENLVTRKLETQLKGVPDLEEMVSQSSEGVSNITLEFTPDVDMTDALQKVRDAVELAKPELPQDVRDDMLVYEISSDDWPIMQVVLSGPFDLVRLKTLGEDLQEDIEQVSGVLSVDLTGGVEREVQVEIDPERLRAFDLGLQDVKDAIALENVTLPGGDVSLGTYEYQVRVPGEFESVEAIPDIVLNPGAATPVYVRDVAEVRFEPRERDSISRMEGRESVTLSVKKRSGENILRIADEVRELIDDWRERLHPDADLKVMVDQSVEIRYMVRELENNILSGLLLVVAVLFIFLGLTNSLFVALAIPLSMLISFVVLQAVGFTLNMVVLFSLILALGMLVDNAIVIVENIYRHRAEEGYDQLPAASRGTRQVASAVIASTITTLCAFGPMAFWPGIMGQFMKFLPITVIITLSASLLVALVFNPVLCAAFMRVKPASDRKPGIGDRLMAKGLRSYEPVLRWGLRHRMRTMIAMVLLFAGSLVVFKLFNAGTELFPDVDPTYAFVQITAPSGTRIEQSDRYAREVEREIAKLPDMKAFVTEVGSGGDTELGTSASAPPHLTRLTMEFLRSHEREHSTRKLLEDLRGSLAGFTGARLTIDKQEMGPPTGKPVNIEIHGDDFETLGNLAERIRGRIRDKPGLVDLQDNFDRGLPQLIVRPDLEKAARLGLRTSDLASTIRTAIAGDDVGKYRVGEDEFDIVVRYQRPARLSREDVESYTVFYEGQSIPLTAFAEVEFTTGLAAIHRIDSRRVVTVSAEVTPGTNANDLLADIQRDLSDMSLPAGYSLEYTGESEDQEEAQEFLSRAFAVALMLILIVLITQFDSVVVPVVILASVVLSLIGVFLGLVVMRLPFGIIMTGVGVISLAGVVVNNAIVLLDYILQLRRSGKSKTDAIIEAGKTRFRPVVLTAVTTILGLIPLTTGLAIDFGALTSGEFGDVVVFGGDSSQWWGPMGVAVIWGLAVATFLTLVFVPVMYASLSGDRKVVDTSEIEL